MAENVPKINRNTGVSGNSPGVRYSTTSAAPRNAGDPFEALARNLSAVSDRLENRLDVIAADEGGAQGLSAGSRADVALRRDGTIRGRAFDAAALRAMNTRHDTELRAYADKLYQENKDNPDQLKKSFEDYAGKVKASSVDDEVKINFDLNFQRVSAAYLSDAAARQERLQMDADRAAALSNIEERRKSIERLARLSGNDQQAAVAMAAEIQDLKRFALQHGPKGAFEFEGVAYPADPTRSGAYGVEDIQKLVMNTSDHARENRVLGKFLQAPSLAAKQNILKAFDQEFVSGAADFDLEQYDRLSGRMRADINRMEADARGQAVTVEKELRAVNALIDKGYSPGEEVLAGLEVQASLSGDPAAVAEVREARNLMVFQDQARQLRPDQLQGVINDAYAKINDSGTVTPGQVKRVELAERLLSNMTTELARDPLSWAGRTGIAPVAPISFEDPQSLKARAQAANTVSAYYGTRPQMMTDEEVTIWKDTWDKAGADQRTMMMAAIQDGFGQDAIYAFEDLSKVAPSLANVGGLLSQSPAHAATARDYSIGDAAIASGTRVLQDNANTRSAQHIFMGNAYNYAPATMNAVLDTAEKLYTAKALRKGLTMDDFDQALYGEALQQAAGQWKDRDGRARGGLINQRSTHYLVLPPDMTEDDFDQVLANMDETGLLKASVGGGAGVYQNGEIFEPDDLRDAYLISSGPGRYIVSTADPAKGPPVFVTGTNPDGLFEIDLMQMRGAR